MATTQQDANQYIFQDGQWIKVGKTKLVTVQEAGPAPTVAASKQIYLSVYTTALEVCFCRVHLFNFDLTDIGSKVFLYRKRNNKRRGHKAIWNHPLDYTVATQTGKNIMGCGYGILAGITDVKGNTWLGLNTYQIANGHNGFIQTEWELTETDINNGYIDINLSEMAIDLLMPGYSTDASWEEAAANTHLKFMGQGTFKFDIVDKEGKQVTCAYNKLHLTWYGVLYEFDNITTHKLGEKYFITIDSLNPVVC